MQESWQNDEDKLTFIILSAQDIEDGHNELDAMIGNFARYLVFEQWVWDTQDILDRKVVRVPQPYCTSSFQFSWSQNNYSGDVNLFLNDPEDDCCGEVEVMIAESRARQKGCATEALKLLMGYCYDKIRISKFVAKIGKHNLKSYSLFKNKVITFDIFDLFHQLWTRA